MQILGTIISISKDHKKVTGLDPKILYAGANEFVLICKEANKLGIKVKANEQLIIEDLEVVIVNRVSYLSVSSGIGVQL
jgi:hypothetical protein